MTASYVRHQDLKLVARYIRSYYDSELGRMITVVEMLSPGEGETRRFFTDELERITLLEAMAFLAQ